jgi:hypothetical protein
LKKIKPRREVILMKRRMRWLVTLTLLAVVVVIWYYVDSNKPLESDGTKEVGEVTEIDKVLNKDLEKSYPHTAREVIQLFIRIQKCYYNEKWSEEEFVKLAYKATELFDEELKNSNPFDEYYEELKTEVSQYKDEKKIINRTILDKTSEIVYSTVEEQKYASLNCTYYLKSASGTSKVIETYILRKDEEDRWKILGWKEYEESEWEQ